MEREDLTAKPHNEHSRAEIVQLPALVAPFLDSVKSLADSERDALGRVPHSSIFSIEGWDTTTQALFLVPSP